MGELADTAEKNISEKKPQQSPLELHGFHKMLLRLRDLKAIVVAESMVILLEEVANSLWVVI